MERICWNCENSEQVIDGSYLMVANEEGVFEGLLRCKFHSELNDLEVVTKNSNTCYAFKEKSNGK